MFLVLIFNIFLFPDAEASEDIPQQFVGGHLAGDGSQMVECIAEVYGHEVGGDAVGKALRHCVEGLSHKFEGLIVAGVGEEDVLLARVAHLRMESAEDLFPEGFKAQTRLAREAQPPYPAAICQQVGLGVHLDNRLVRKVKVGLLARLGGITEIEHYISLFHGFLTTLHAECFHTVIAVTKAGGVDKAEGDAVEGEGFLNGVARGAGDVADDGTVVSQQGVEQRRLAGIGFADDGHRDAAFQGVAQTERGNQA